MSLVYSPLNESILDSPPKSLHPRHAFILRQIGNPPPIDEKMVAIVSDVFQKHNFKTIDSNHSVGGNDYMDKIMSFIRSTGFTIAIFSKETRAQSLANIALELGFAAMSGKPLVLIKSRNAPAPSDLTRADWINFDPGKEDIFTEKLTKAAAMINTAKELEDDLLQIVLGAKAADCAVAFERANKAFLLSGDIKFIQAARSISERLATGDEPSGISDLSRLKSEIDLFVLQAERATRTSV